MKPTVGRHSQNAGLVSATASSYAPSFRSAPTMSVYPTAMAESKSGALRAEVVKVFWTLTPCRKSHVLHHNSKQYSPATASRIHEQSNSSLTRACECCLDSLRQPLCQQGKVVQSILPTNSTHSKRSFSNEN